MRGVPKNAPGLMENRKGRTMPAGKHLSEKKKASNQRYLDTLDELKVRVPKGTRAVWKAAADSEGLSLNSFIVSAVKDKLRCTPTKKADCSR